MILIYSLEKIKQWIDVLLIDNKSIKGKDYISVAYILETL